ncbi:MAG: 16S rRNA (cytidine(1402)-2'-O)-methyltransferase [Firmicutes bacterium]|nr:16S rRNA (cytidine(1402)-2'-O)-methyltransferase [Bacillota bacterium]
MLYFVATPIGNLKEITYRAVEVLGAVDCIYAENPRHSLVLLNEYGIKKPVFEHQKFSEREKTAEIIEKLKSGLTIAVVSDAGTPLISDPGSVLVAELIKNELPYTLVNGPCAAVAAVVLSGINAGAFCMAGFLPEKKGEREAFIARFLKLEATLVFYAAVHDVIKDLAFLHKRLGARKAAVVREISKKFESVTRFTLGEAPEFPLRGEIVLVIEGYKPQDSAQERPSVAEALRTLIDAGADKKEAVKLVAAEYGMKKSEVYLESVVISTKNEKRKTKNEG